MENTEAWTGKRSAPRREEIMRLLATHNAVSSRTIEELLETRVSRRRVRAALASLIKGGLVVRRSLHLYGGHAYYYQLATELREALRMPPIYWGTLPHNDYCSRVHAELIRTFPNARVWREHQIAQAGHLKHILGYQHDVPDSLPDLVLELPSPAGSRSTFIALEIERMAKSSRRLQYKLTKYARRTMLDGVVYLSDDPSLLRKLRRFYSTQGMSKALRISHYAQNFFMTGDLKSQQKVASLKLLNAEDGNISFMEWICFLTTKQMFERRDENSPKPTVDGTPETAAK